MNIGEAAARSGVSAKMIRYYESVGLIDSASRNAAGYRQYDDRDLHTLRFVRRARDLGFSVQQIGNLVALWRDRSRHSSDVRRLAQVHIAELQDKINQLEGMVSTLSHLVHCCRGDDRPECPILAELQTDGSQLSPTTTARRVSATGSRGASTDRRRKAKP